LGLELRTIQTCYRRITGIWDAGTQRSRTAKVVVD
jgi:hypothetical protein